MGREIERILRERNHTVVAKVDPFDSDADCTSIVDEMANEAEVALDFSTPDSAINNVDLYGQLKLDAVVGTTGWYDQIEMVRQIVEKKDIGLIYGSNFSVGAHLFFMIVEQTVRYVESLKEYDVLAYEVHHKRKKDAPSGTALSLAQIICKNIASKTEVVTETLHRKREEHELHVGSVRGGEVPGIHTVLIDSLADTIELTHRARNRGGFALGAVQAGEWIQNKRGLYEVNDFVRDILVERS